MLAICCLSNCATTERHQFAQPESNWQVRTGQLMYRNAKTTLIGDVVVRFSKTGDFELTFSKGPGMPLLVLRQDAQFAQVSGTFARNGWSGPVDRAPQQLRAWLELRDQILKNPTRNVIRQFSSGETLRIQF
jgi:hypothetical protein